MKLKRSLPVLFVLILTFLLFLGTTAYSFFLTKYPEDITARLMLSLRQSIVSAGVVLVLLLLGLGLNTLLARIQDTSRRRLISLTVYIGSLLLCVVLPALLIAATWLVFSDQKGWQELPPVTEPAVQIAAAGKEAVTVRSDDGNFYYCWTRQFSQCWEITNEPSSLLMQTYEGELKTTSNPPGVTPPNDVIDMVGVAYNESAIFYESHYVVTSDGRVWYLNRETNNGTAGFASGLLFIITLPLMLGTLTVLAGAGIGGVSRWLANRIWHEIE